MSNVNHDLVTPGARLRWSRERRYGEATDAAIAIGVKPPTYIHHENGTRGFNKHLWRYARFFGVRPEWLATGRGEPFARGQTDSDAHAIRIDGVVGAGPGVSPLRDDAAMRLGEIVMPADGHLGGLIVEGDSQMPRWRNNEVIVYDRRPARPEDLLGCYAVVRNADGERLVKIVRRGAGDNRWRLDSHNADPLEDVFLIGAHRIVATIHRHPASPDDELPAPILPKRGRSRR